jgi:hypothetical protein
VLRDDSDGYLFFDAGAMGPAEVPGHGHADALSFVLHGGGRPLIVDPGVFTYEAGSCRDHFRSTRAHNTVTVAGEDQCYFLGPFRVARIPCVRLLETSDCSVLGEIDGYGHSIRNVSHRRRISRVGRGRWDVEDTLEGEGVHHGELTFQASPGARCETREPVAELSWDGGPTLVIRCLNGGGTGRVSIEEGWVSTGWNSKVRAPRVVFSWKQSMPTRICSALEVV